MMKKTIAFVVCLALCMAAAQTVSAKEVETVKTLPPVVAQMSGMAGTVIMWHTTDGDDKADYVATYIFKDGKLHRISQKLASQENLRYQIIGR